MNVVTRISRTRTFDKQLEKVPSHIRKKFMLWVFLVETQGLSEVQKRAGFHDEPLSGQRHGQRSVRLNRAYRVIYRVIHDRIHIELLEVHKHEY